MSNQQEQHVLAFTAKACDLHNITARSNDSDGVGLWKQWVKDVISMPDGACMVVICRHGFYPYMTNRWEEDIAKYLPEVQCKLDRQKAEDNRTRAWLEKQNSERSDKLIENDTARQEAGKEFCGQCGSEVLGHHHCQGVPGWEGESA